MKTLLFLISCCIGSYTFAQKTNPVVKLYVFNKDWKGCQPEEAEYLGRLEEIDDTTYQWKYYRYTGPLLSIETYKDKESNIAHGLFAFYGVDGKLDSIGYTANNRKEKDWTYYTDSNTVFRRDEYKNGKLIRSLDTLAMRLEADSLKQAYDQKEQDSLQVEAYFKNGDAGWRKYIQNNINFPDRARKLGKQGMVMLQFIVQTDGSLSDFFILQSLEYSVDEEALRLLKKSPRWIPARQFGKMVKAYRRQPLTFQLQ